MCYGDPRDGTSQSYAQGQSSGSPAAPHGIKSLWFLITVGTGLF